MARQLVKGFTKGWLSVEFNKELLADLLQRAEGDRSLNRFGHEADVDPGYLSRLLRRRVETAPSATVLIKIAGKAANNVTVTQLLDAAYGNHAALSPTGNPPSTNTGAPTQG